MFLGSISLQSTSKTIFVGGVIPPLAVGASSRNLVKNLFEAFGVRVEVRPNKNKFFKKGVRKIDVKRSRSWI